MPIDDYQHDRRKFADAGLQLNLPVDVVPPMQYSRLNNAVPKTEGLLQSRDGLTSIATVLASNDLHTIFRLNQEVPSVTGERLVWVGTRLFQADLPLGSSFSELTGFSFDGLPVSVISFRFTNDQASWAIMGNASGMRKRRDGFYQTLGLVPPLTAAVGTDAGAGNLDSDGGVGFDWRYTYVNETTNTESNGSPNLQTGTEERRPTDQDNPDGVIGGNAYANPANAFDDDTATFSRGTADSAVHPQTASCRWKTWAAASGAYSSLVLRIDNKVTVSGSTGAVIARLEYSTNGGSTFNSVYGASASRARMVDEIVIPASTDLAQLRVRGRVNTIVAGDKTIDQDIHEIFIFGTLVTAADSLLLLSGGRQADVCVVAPTDAQQTAIRLYRRGGSRPSNHFFVGEFPTSTLVQGACDTGSLTITDNIADSGLGDSLELDNDQPITSVETSNTPLPRIWGPFDERVLGCGDVNRPESVYFSKRGNADAWPPQNHIEVGPPGNPIQTGVVYNTRSFAFSTERMYELLANITGGTTLISFQTPSGRGAISPWGVTVAESIYFVSKDGVYRTQGGAETSIVRDSIQPLFPTQEGPGRDLNGLEAVNMTLVNDIRLEYHNGELWFTYKGATTGDRQTLIYDITRQRWRAATYTPEAVTFFSEESTTSSLLVGGDDGILYSTGGARDDTTNIVSSLRTGSHDQGIPLNQKEYGNVIFDLDPGGATTPLPITITPIINGEVATQPSITVTGTGRQQVALDLSDVFAFNLAFDVSWTKTDTIAPVLFQYDILFRVEPAALAHFETRESSLGLAGFMHLRDGYIGIRSNVDVTLTIEGDGTAIGTPETIVSTAGARKRVYISLPANKAKVYRFIVDRVGSSGEFRLYEGDTEFRVRQWATNLGYQLRPVLGGERVG